MTDVEIIDVPGSGNDAVLAVVVMGVCGTGKTTVGASIAERLGCPFLEGDSFHPPENVEKMRAGFPLDDDDRWPWLERLGRAIGEHAQQNQPVVATCSALKRAYRDRLRLCAGRDIFFIMLDGDRDLLEERMAARTDHYMPPALLESQLAILERPGADETSVSLDVAEKPDQLIARALSAIAGAPPG